MLKKILDNPTLMSWSKAIVNFGSAIFVLPIILAVYTPVEQSFWFIINSIIGFALLADSGFGSVLVRAVSYFKSGADFLPKNRDEYDNDHRIESDDPNFKKITDLISTTRRIYFFLSLLVIILLLTGGTAFIWNIMELANHRKDFWIAFYILIPTAIIMILNIRWTSILRGLNFVAAEARFSTMLGMLRVFLFALLLSFGLKPVFLVATMLLLAIINFYFVRSRVLIWLKQNSTYQKKGEYDKDIFTSLWGATWRIAGISWGNYFVSTSNSILAVQIPEARLMANFLFTARILEFVKNIAYVPFYSNIPEIYSLGAKKEFGLLKKRFSEYFVTATVILMSAYLTINILGNPILHLFGISTEFMGLLFITIMCMSIFFDMHSSFHSSVYASTNHIPFFWPSVISGILVVGLGILVTPVYGLLGIISVRFLVQISFSNWYSVYLDLKLLNWNPKNYISEFPKLGIKGVYKNVSRFLNLDERKKRNAA